MSMPPRIQMDALQDFPPLMADKTLTAATPGIAPRRGRNKREGETILIFPSPSKGEGINTTTISALFTRSVLTPVRTFVRCHRVATLLPQGEREIILPQPLPFVQIRKQGSVKRN